MFNTKIEKSIPFTDAVKGEKKGHSAFTTNKVDVKYILRIGSAHNKRGHADLKMIEIAHFSDFF